MKKNILEICLSPDLGGLELCVLDYYNYFAAQTDAFLVVSPNSKLDESVKTNNKFLLKRNKFFPLFPAFILAKYIDENVIDIVHFHWTRDIAIVVLAKVLSTRKPKVIQSRHMTMTRFKNDFYHKWLYKNIDTIHAVTNQVKEQLERFIPQDVRPQVEMLYLGVDEPRIYTEKIKNLRKEYDLKDEFVIGIVGRIEKGKGQYLVIKALEALKNLKIKALIVGHTMDEKYLLDLKNKAKLLGVQERIVFSGFTKDINEHMQLCDVTILATSKETFGLVVIESMVNKTPVIATKSGGPLEIIDDGVDGLFFNGKSGDLAEKIKDIYEDSELKNRLCENGYKKVLHKFNKSVQMKKLYEVLNAS